jgi:hypothetical protein
MRTHSQDDSRQPGRGQLLSWPMTSNRRRGGCSKNRCYVCRSGVRWQHRRRAGGQGVNSAIRVRWLRPKYVCLWNAQSDDPRIPSTTGELYAGVQERASPPTRLHPAKRRSVRGSRTLAGRRRHRGRGWFSCRRSSSCSRRRNLSTRFCAGQSWAK